MNAVITRWINRPEFLFAIIGLIWGMLYLVITPPLQVADEDRHFYRAFQVAEGGLIADVHEGQAGGWLPESVLQCGSSTTYMRWKPTKKITGSQITTQFKRRLNPDNRVFVSFRSSVYSPVAYLPSALAIRIGIWLKFPPILLMYFGRMMNLICWLLLIYMAIRIIPFYKWALFALALTPMSLYQAASLSADCMTNAFAIFAIGYFIHLAYDCGRDLKPCHMAIIFLLTIALSLSKIVFFLFCFLFLLIPREKFWSYKKYYLIFLLLAAVNFLSCFIWYKIVRSLPIVWKPDVFPDQQIRFIVSRPLEYMSILMNHFIGQIEYCAKSFVGRFGWMDTPLPKPHFWAWTFVLFSTAFTDSSKTIKMKISDKFRCLFVFSSISVFIITSLYIYWNPVGSEEILGVQGRYFVPIAPLFFLCFYNRRFCYQGSLKPVILVLCSVLSLTVALSVVYHRFYVP